MPKPVLSKPVCIQTDLHPQEVQTWFGYRFQVRFAVIVPYPIAFRDSDGYYTSIGSKLYWVSSCNQCNIDFCSVIVATLSSQCALDDRTNHPLTCDLIDTTPVRENLQKSFKISKYIIIDQNWKIVKKENLNL